MTLYEIDQSILDCIDMETGEIVDPEKFDALQIERNEKIEKVALWYKNLLSDAAAIKAEKDALSEREAAAKKKAESLKNWLSEALNGKKISTAKVAISFRRSESVEIEDEAAFIEEATKLNRDDLLTFKDPTPNKTAIKAAIKDGVSFASAKIIEKQNIQIK